MIRGLLVFALILSAQDRGSQPSPRIVSLAPSLTEILVDLGATASIVGVTRYERDSAVASVPRVGGWVDPSLEAVLALQPDLVLLTRAQEAFVGPGLRRLGLRYRTLPARHLQDVFLSLDSLGKWLHLETRATRLKQALQETLQAYRQRAARVRRIPVVFVADRTPGTLQNLYLVGRGTFLHELLEATGFENLVRQTGYVPVNAEYLVQLDPPWILEMVQGVSLPRPVEQGSPDPAWRRAGLADRVIRLNADLFSHPSTRFPILLRILWQIHEAR